MTARDGPAKVGVVILNYNCAGILRECLASVLGQSHANLWVCVVDNGSEDGSARMVHDSFPGVELVETNQNIGFAGFNVGIDRALAANCTYVMYLDSDAKLDSGAIGNLARYLEAHPECGIAGPQQCRYATGEPYFLGSLIDLRTLMSRGIVCSDRPTECDYMGNALVRSEILRANKFDERFFTYYADTDLCVRVRQLGHRIVGVPAARMFSMERYTSSLVPGLRGFIPARNRLLFLSKHTPRRYWPIAIPFALLDSFSKLTYWVARRQMRNAAFVLIGLGSGFMFLTGGAEPTVWRELVMGGMRNKVVIASTARGVA